MMKLPQSSINRKPLAVAVCVPSNGLWRAETARSLAVMFGTFSSTLHQDYRSQRLSIMAGQGSMLSQLRETMVRAVLQKGFTHLLFIDSDMVFPNDTLCRLLARDKDIIACNCTTKTPPIVPTAHDLKGKRLNSNGKTGIQKVQQVGLAVMLIKREVLESMRPPMFLMDWISEYKAYCGEDIFFCQKAQAAGWSLWVDHELSREIRHIGTMSAGHDMVLKANLKGLEVR